MAGDEVDRPLADEHGLGLAEAPVGAGRGRVGGDDRGLGAHGVPRVGLGQHARQGEQRTAAEVRQVAPGVAHGPGPQAPQASVAVEGHVDVDGLAPSLVGGDEGLVAVLDPLHRTTQVEGGEADHHLVLVEVVLQPEAAADVGGDDPDAVLGQAGDLGDAVADGVGRLAGGPDREAAVGVGGGDDAPRLHRGAHHPADVEPERERLVGGREHGVGVLGRVAHVEAAHHVVVATVVEERCTRLERGTGVDHRGELVDLDQDAVDGVLGPVAVVGHDDADGLTDEAHAVADDRAVVLELARHVPDHREAAPGHRQQLGRTEHGGDRARRPRWCRGPRRVPWATGDRTMAACRSPGSSMSSVKRPRPVSSRGSSKRGRRWPTQVMRRPLRSGRWARGSTRRRRWRPGC